MMDLTAYSINKSTTVSAELLMCSERAKVVKV